MKTINIMRQVLHHIIIIIVTAILLTNCSGKGDTSQSNIPDETVYTRADSLVIGAGMVDNFERVITLSDSLVAAGELSPIRANNYRGIAYVSMGDIQKAIEYFRLASADDNPPAEDFWEYINAGSNLANLQNAQHDLDGAIRTALLFIERLKKVDHPCHSSELPNLYFCLGNTQIKLERTDEAMKSFDDAFYWLKICMNNDSTGKEMRTAMRTLENIAIAHLNIEKFDEAEKWINREDSLLAIYKTKAVADSTEVDFIHALITLNRAQICQVRGQEAQAARYYDEYTTSDFGKSAEGHIQSCAYLMAAHRYSEAAHNFTYLDHFMKSRGLELDMETIGEELVPKLRSNYYAGHKDSALQTAMKIAEAYDSALIRQKHSDAAELAVAYDTQGKERQIAEEQARNRLYTTISISVSIGALLILGFAIFVFRLWRITKEKNRILAQQITEAVEYREKLREQKKEQKKIQEAKDESDAKAGLSISDLTTLDDEQLFLCLRDMIENEQLFLQPDFGRQTLIDRTGLTKECIGAAFSQGCDRSSLPAYVRELRLDHAIRLMNDRPSITVEQVCQCSGFTSADTFTRNFRTKYGMTPTAYKQTLSGE